MEKFNKIKILDDNLINKIAAGEVIERPSSIVKELVENAIDANAKNISIEIKNGGKSYIKIQDDGTGIKKDEINTAFIRHSTSKITDIDDLDNILTLGFRGEALASIASIARVEMTTKTEHDDIGTQISIEGGVFKSKKEIATLVGSTFVIKDIFFNIPARLKFLKKDASESFYITEIITKLALGNPNVSFKYLNNNTEIISTDGSGILKNTALYVYGGEIAKALLPIEATKNNFKLTGLVGRPEISRGNRNYSNFFINNRYIKSKLVNDAIGEAYSGKLMNSKFPVVILNLTTPEGSVDVNVHPTKLEARFENENFIYEFLIDSIEEELSKHILIPSIAVSKDKSIIKNNVEFNTNNNIIDLTQASELDINNSSADLSTPQALELDIKSTTDLSTPQASELDINNSTADLSIPQASELDINNSTADLSIPQASELDINNSTADLSTPQALELDINNSSADLSTPQALELDINNSSADLSTPQALELDVKSNADLSTPQASELDINNSTADLSTPQALELDINNSSADLSTPQALELDVKSNADLSTPQALELDINNSSADLSTPQALELDINNSSADLSTPQALELDINNSSADLSTPQALELDINNSTADLSTPQALELDINNSSADLSTPQALELDINNSSADLSTPQALELDIKSTTSQPPKQLELTSNIASILNQKEMPIARDLLTKTLPKEVNFKKQDLSEDVVLNKNTFFNNYKIVGQIFHTYWIIQQESELYIIDQHSAHEKIIYEELYESFLNSKVYSQTLVEPIVLQVSSYEKELINQNQKIFDKFGFTIEKFNDDCYAISRVPFIFKNALSPSSFVEILDSLSEDNIKSISTENKRNNKSIYSFKVEQIIMMSCKKAVKANDRLSTQEAQVLIEKLLLLKDPFNCPHGRPTIVKITKSEIEKFFKRI